MYIHNYLLCILDIGSCPTDGLTIVPQTQRQLTHNNYDEQFDFLDPILVGSTANIYCQSTNLRITQDKWDEHSTDYNLTVLCKPDKTFLLPGTIHILRNHIFMIFGPPPPHT